MTRMVSLLMPFSRKQQITVYEDGNKIFEDEKIPLDDYMNTVMYCVDKYNVELINLIGAKHYAAGIKKQIQEKELMLYNENKLIINIR